jgi:DNA-directed RNA polymerase specialized sigma24 family protein
MPDAPRPDAALDAATPEVQRAAFRELHGARIHGFALLLVLGDRGSAARLAAEAIAAGAQDIATHRHPERAAAWLRARVVANAASVRGMVRDRQPVQLDDLAVGRGTFAGLAALGRRERAALIAADVERLDPADVATIVARSGPQLDDLLHRARQRFLAAATGTDDYAPPGSISERLQAAAARAWA